MRRNVPENFVTSRLHFSGNAVFGLLNLGTADEGGATHGAGVDESSRSSRAHRASYDLVAARRPDGRTPRSKFLFEPREGLLVSVLQQSTDVSA